MFKQYRRRWQLAKVKPGDGSTLQEYRFWQLFSRSLFVLRLPQPSGGSHVFEVDVRLMADSTTRRSPASLYRDGVQVSRANLPVTFPVPGGVIEVATSQYGLKRMHYVRDDGSEHTLRPHPRSQEGLRARFDQRHPRASAVIGAASVVVVLAGLLFSLTLLAEALTRVPVVAEHVGTFTSPVHLTGWAKTALSGVAALAATERALALRSRWVIGR